MRSGTWPDFEGGNTPRKLAILIPSALSLTRFPLACFLLYFAREGWWAAAFFAIVYGQLSDGIDGSLARKLNAQSKVGMRIDGTSDVLVDIATIAGITLYGPVPNLAAIVLSAMVSFVRTPGLLGLPAEHPTQKLAARTIFVSTPAMVAIAVMYALRAFGVRGVAIAVIIAIPVALVAYRLRRYRVAAWMK